MSEKITEACQLDSLKKENSHLNVNEIKLIADAAADRASKKAVKEFMEEYKLTPAHWVWVNQEYEKTMKDKSLIRRVVITTFIAFVAVLLGSGIEHKIKRWFIADKIEMHQLP